MSAGEVGSIEAGEKTFLLLWLEPNFSPLYVHVSGFTPGAKDLFKQENYLALYRLPSDEMVKETILGKLSSITKRRPPLSHMINLFVKDTTTSKALGIHLIREDLFRRECRKCHTGIVWSPYGNLALPMASIDMLSKPW